MVLINETVKASTDQKGFQRRNSIAINSSLKTKDRCTWNCHSDTNYCKINHVKLSKSFINKIDPIYFGIIKSLKSTGKYRLANIVFLVILIPLILYWLLIKSISMQIRINALLNKNKQC